MSLSTTPDAVRLRELAAQLDTILESAPVAIGLFDREVRHVRVNAVLADMNGLPAAELLGRTPSELHGAVGAQAEQLYRGVMESGEPMLDVPLSGEVGSRPGDVRQWSASFAPVREDGATLGLMVIVADVTEERRLGDALARSEERHRQLAEDLQRSLLPPVLPRLAGAELASVYRPASGGATVGGDFYDVVRISPTSWALVIGDVQGKGPVAASMTAAVRYAIRTATVHAVQPAEVLRTVNAVLLREEYEEGLCTVAFVLAERDGDGIRLRSAAAGHPQPLIVRHATGNVEVLGRPGMLLGVAEELDLPEATGALGPGDSLVLYTDGATEARFSTPEGHVELFGDARLHALLRSSSGAYAAALAARIETAVLDFQAGAPADDLALVVLRAANQAEQ